MSQLTIALRYYLFKNLTAGWPKWSRQANQTNGKVTDSSDTDTYDLIGSASENLLKLTQWDHPCQCHLRQMCHLSQ